MAKKRMKRLVMTPIRLPVMAAQKLARWNLDFRVSSKTARAFAQKFYAAMAN
jgi:hypothetical protein